MARLGAKLPGQLAAAADVPLDALPQAALAAALSQILARPVGTPAASAA
jgi:hypothetical protein